MNILFIDTSSMILTVGTVRGAKVISRSVDAGQKGHTGILLSVIDDVLKKSALDVNDVEAVALVVGPGSFTGIRIGAATATAIAQAVGAKRISVTAFDVLAYNRADVSVAVEAGHGNLYTAKCSGGKTVSTEFVQAQDAKVENYVFKPASDPADVLAAIAREKAEKGEFVSVFEPYYMRKSQAERNRDEI